jgi:hypothetical protein
MFPNLFELSPSLLIFRVPLMDIPTHSYFRVHTFVSTDVSWNKLFMSANKPLHASWSGSRLWADWYVRYSGFAKRDFSWINGIKKKGIRIVKFSGMYWRVLKSIRAMIDLWSPWWWRQHAPLKRRSTSFWEHGRTSQKTTLNIILDAVRTWNLTYKKSILRSVRFVGYQNVFVCVRWMTRGAFCNFARADKTMAGTARFDVLTPEKISMMLYWVMWPWRWKHNVSLKRCLRTSLHSVITRKNIVSDWNSDVLKHGFQTNGCK